MNAKEPEGILPEKIDTGLVEAVVRAELTDLWADYETPRFSIAQQLRTFAIEWLATLLPWRISAQTAALIEGTSEALRGREDFDRSGWHRVLPLDVGLFAITGGESYLYEATLNIDHHNSTLRKAVLDSLALVADQLEFENEELRSRVESNLSKHHLCAELGVLIVAASRGGIDQKRALFSDWLPIGNAFAKETLESLVAGTPVANPFSDHIARITEYTFGRLAAVETSRQKGSLLTSLLPPGNAAEMESSVASASMLEATYPSSLLRACVLAHPLAAPSVTLEGLQEEEEINA
jgi:hypothetical protein